MIKKTENCGIIVWRETVHVFLIKFMWIIPLPLKILHDIYRYLLMFYKWMRSSSPQKQVLISKDISLLFSQHEISWNNYLYMYKDSVHADFFVLFCFLLSKFLSCPKILPSYCKAVGVQWHFYMYNFSEWSPPIIRFVDVDCFVYNVWELYMIHFVIHI